MKGKNGDFGKKEGEIMIAYDNMGNRYSLTETSLGGGEGTLYLVEQNSALCAKIFKPEKRTRGREAKILEWEKLFSEKTLDKSFCKQVVVPQKCLYERPDSQNTGTFMGYLMEKQVNFQKLEKTYTSKEFNYMQKVWTARNLCILTNLVHSLGKGIIIGDYNADNLAVFPATSTAKFIDVDSFQLTLNRNGKKILCPCTVGVPEFMAPEISRRLKREKSDLENVDQSPDDPIFNKYTDLYSLAYHVFALLMNGSAPYAAMANMEEISQHPSRNVSSVDIDRFHAAEKGEFVFARHYLFKKAPIYAPKYGILSRQLQKLFERAFITGATDPTARPDSLEFYMALTEYIESLEKRSCGHYMPSHYHGPCEWDRLENLKL